MDLRTTPSAAAESFALNANEKITGPVTVLTATRVIFYTLFRMIYPFMNVFARGLGIDLAQLSLAMTTRSMMGFLGPFLADIADRYGRKISMMLGLILFIIANGAIWFFPYFPVFFAGLSLGMLGMLMFIPAMQAFISDYVPYERRGRALGITELSWSLSFIAGVPLIGWLMTRSSLENAWLVPFPVLAIAGVVCLLLIIWRVPNNKPPATTHGNSFAIIGKLLRIKPVLAGLGMGIAISAGNEIINLVFGVWLEDRFTLKLAALGAASAVIGVSEMSGEGLSALLSDKLGKQLTIRCGMILVVLAIIFLYFFSGSVVSALVGLFLFYMGFEFTLVSSLPLMSEVYPAARATVMALTVACFSLGRALGAFLAPRLYQVDFLFNLIASILLILSAFFLLRFVHPQRDEAMEGIGLFGEG